ncbi:MAG: UMP kinase [Clostridiales bacterium]|nr:UMP kinase [Clostridiales bacterium]
MYKRVLLKLSGEALGGPSGTGIDPETVDGVVTQLVELAHKGVEIAIVVGGGNFWRGRQGVAMNRVTADHMGMLATVMNALALQDAIENKGVSTRVQTALTINSVAEPFILRKAIHHFEEGRIVILACGTGNPYFTTDSGAALRAAEIKADVLLMAKNVDGVYDCDPKTNKNAKKYKELSYMDVINKNIAVMDFTSITMCMENKIPIVAFGLSEKNSIIRAAEGEMIGTIIH